MKVAIVNDGLVATEAIRRVVVHTPGLQLSWIAADGAEAVARCAGDLPDLLLMDLIMPGMDGVEATRRIMAETPCAILLVTATMEGNSGKVFEALGYGALDVVKTPVLGPGGNGAGGAGLVEKIELLGRLATGKPTRGRAGRRLARAGETCTSGLVVIGASAGGPAAILAVLSRLPADFPAAVVVVQHLDAQFAPLMAEWLSGSSPIPVRMAVDGDYPVPGTVLLAGTNDHLSMGEGCRLSYTVEPRGQMYRPSVDVFFESVARHWQGKIVALLLTGMGRDGAKGLKILRDHGALTIAQHRASCIVYGMPKAAVELRAASEVLPLDQIGDRLAQSFSTSAPLP